MPLWWGKPSSKDVQRKTHRVSFIDAIHRKLIKVSAFKNLSKYGDSGKYFNDALSEKGLTFPRSESPSLLVSRCQSFNDHPHALPLPLPQWKHLSVRGDVSEVTTSEMGLHECPMRLPGSLHSKHDKPLSPDAWANLATASVSSYGSMDVDDQPESQILSPQASEHESGNLTASHSPSCMGHQDQSPKVTQQISMDQWKPVNMLPNNSIPLPSKHRGPLRTHMTKLQIPSRGGFFSAPDSSISTPSRSPVGACRHEQFGKVGCCSGRLCSDVIFVGSGQCSSPVSGQNSGDMSLLSPPSRCSPESSPILSPAVTSPGSQRQSGVATPLHPWAGLMAAETFMERPDDRKAQGHKLPCPLMTVPSSCSFPSSCLATHPRSPGRAEGVTRPNSCWKKGRLLGSGTYGRVYIGFNSESGEMCAMKEVALFPDDAKSKESVEQLEQEIKLLSHLKHSNIVRYFGSETVDDKLYIYLEYVSGGSIHKLLQEYGQLGESAIRSYTKQILSGLAYLHAKSTVHRDIKGANILVDPTGRVKLADFGMAKHITGQPCPLSFKGSPYWMAPEVIRNSNGCNLAVDVWSLGCTVIEMATAKPPWSQYEGVAALFKIGNSKELPTIPDHLSEEGKDFVRQCLQRNPLHRPTAVQLLKHPFVKNVAPLKRSLVHAELQELQQPVSNAARHMDIGCKKRYSGLEKERVNLQLARGFKIGSVSRETCIPKHLSCPVSPIGSPLLNTKLSQTTLSRMKSPSTLSRPHTVSASSTPYTRGTRAPPHHFAHSKTAYLYQSFPARRPQNGLYANQSPSYCKPRVGSETSHNIRGISQASRDSFFSKQQFY